MLPFRSIIPGIRDSLTPPVKRVTAVQRDRLRRVTFGPPRTYPPGDPKFVGPPSPVGPSRPDTLRFGDLNKGAPSPDTVRAARTQASQYSEEGTPAFRRNFNQALTEGKVLTPTEEVERGIRKPRSPVALVEPLNRDIQFLKNQVQPIAGDIGRETVGRALTGLGETLPGQLATTAINQLPGTLPSGEQAGEWIGEAVIPVNVWQVALELLPGVGTVPGLASAVRKGSPEAILALRKAGAKLGESETVERAIKGLASERGALKLTADEGLDALRTEISARNKATGAKLRVTRVANAGERIAGQTGKRGEFALSGTDAMGRRTRVEGDAAFIRKELDDFVAPLQTTRYNLQTPHINRAEDIARARAYVTAQNSEVTDDTLDAVLNDAPLMDRLRTGSVEDAAAAASPSSTTGAAPLRAGEGAPPVEPSAVPPAPGNSLTGAGDLPRSLPTDNPPAFNPSPEELAHLENLIDHGDWTKTPGARIGAKSIVRMLQKGEQPSDKQMGMLMRVLGSQQPSAPVAEVAKPGVRTPKKPRVRTPKAEALAPRKPRIVGGDDLPPEEPPMPTTPSEPVPDRVLAGDEGAQTGLDLGAVRLADGWRNKTLADIADSPNFMQRLENFWDGLIGTPRFIANNKKDLAAAVIQIPRTLKTAIDIGWGGRNGWRLFPKHMRAWGRMYGRQYTTLASEDAYTGLQAQTAALPHFERLKAAGLAFLERGTGELESTSEVAMSRFTQNLPVINRTERAYIAPGNAMRYEIADDVITKWEKANGVPMPDDLIKKLADHYNAATLRGNTRYLAKAHAEVLGSILFSTKGLVSGPQYVAGGIRMLADSSIDAAVRKEIAGDVAAYIAAGMGTMGLIAVTGAGIADINTHSPTFGQVEVGPIRWNYWGADQSMVRQILTQLQGDKSIDGVTESVQRPTEAWRYISNKLAPGVPRTAWDSAVNRGRTFEGRDVNSPEGFGMNIVDQFKPIPAETGQEAYGNAGAIGAIVSVLADLNGFTTSTYELTPRITKEQYEAKKVIDKSGYNDIGADIWKELQADGSAPKEYETPTDMRNAIIAEVLAEIEGETPDADPIQSQAIAERVTNNVGVFKLHDKLTTQARDSLIRSYPKLAESLVIKGDRSATGTQEILTR